MKFKYTKEGRVIELDKGEKIYCKNKGCNSKGVDNIYYFCEVTKFLYCQRCIMSYTTPCRVERNHRDIFIDKIIQR